MIFCGFVDYWDDSGGHVYALLNLDFPGWGHLWW